MFSRKKPEPQKKRSRDSSQYGIFELPDDFDPSEGIDDDGGDSDFEAELAAITRGETKPKPKPKPRQLMPEADLDRMVSESLRDISDEDISGDDDDDPELLGELQDLTGESIENNEIENQPTKVEEPSQVFLPTTTTNISGILKTRIQMYQAAEENAKTSGETGRARRFNRGLKTLNDLLKQVNAGKNINVDDIPPEVAVKKIQPEGGNDPAEESPAQPPSVPIRQAPSIPTPEERKSLPPQSPQSETENPKVALLNAKRQEYKIAALNAKRDGDRQSTVQFVQIIKQFDAVIKAAQEGQEIDLSDMPPPPNELKEFLAKMQAAQAAGENEPPSIPEPVQAEAPSAPVPTTLLGGLQQNLEKYKSVEAAAKAEGNSGKARRFGRIIKQYEDAIKAHKAGKSFAIDELPIPPGFPPLPSTKGAPPVPAVTPQPTPVVKQKPPSPDPEIALAPGSVVTPTPKKSSPQISPKKQEQGTSRSSGNQVGTTLVEKQMKILLERQKEFKVAALEAKRAGEIKQALEYVKISKGFESLLDATSMGLPVDLNTLPIPPSQRDQMEDSFALVTEDDIDEDNDDIGDINVRLEETLAKQLMMCKNTRDHHKAMGDVAGVNRFENLALTVQKDLDIVRLARRKKLPIPHFHYEKRSFNIRHCNTDLTDNELEIIVVRGIQYNVPNSKDVDTYVKIEFPYPQDEPFRAKTSVIKNTDNPDYDQKYIVGIDRSLRPCQRTFKRHAVKFEVYSRGCCLGICRGICANFPLCCFSGFLRSDVLIGTVNVKLQQLETKCEIHDSFNIMDGRKSTGGKLEVKIRLRRPIVTEQMEHIDEKWIVIDV